MYSKTSLIQRHPNRSTSSHPYKLHVNLPRVRKHEVMKIKCQSEVEQDTQANQNVCSTCGVKIEDIPNGCDQKGRIAGGIGAIAGFEWWPIKAYH
eukprot:TRINITY_DN25737_c0_g1_i4.p1 TRINITY_DN25737_c0_g1~~TRINITY_DN25737_c0_g1_i4.p1  ORF type:complete len:106 (-),score=1.32 TRINITY_DN25737_c0_g1_i4:104-388(-)